MFGSFMIDVKFAIQVKPIFFKLNPYFVGGPEWHMSKLLLLHCLMLLSDNSR